MSWRLRQFAPSQNSASSTSKHISVVTNNHNIIVDTSGWYWVGLVASMPQAANSLCFRVRCHIVHLSSAKPLKLIQEARQAGAPLTVETTHHYLSLCAENIPAGATQFKCCPPIRGSINQVNRIGYTLDENWAALALLFFDHL